MKILWTATATHNLRNLDPKAASAIVRDLNRLALTEHGRVKRLHGSLAGQLRLRVGPWRVRFDKPDPGTIRVLLIEKRGDAYRD